MKAVLAITCTLLCSIARAAPPDWVDGLDISAAVDKIDLEAQKRFGARFVWIRCTIGRGTSAAVPRFLICSTLR